MTPTYPQPEVASQHHPPRGVAALGAPMGKCISALQLDGGTRLMRDFDPDRMCDDLAELLRLIRKRRSREEEVRDREAGGLWAVLPVPQLWGAAPYVQVRVGGERRHVVHLHIFDTVYISLDLERGTCQLQAKAKALWSYGWEAWVVRWAGLVSWWLGEDVRTVQDADRDWRVTGIELCCDFIGVPWYAADANRVLAPGVPIRQVIPGKSYRQIGGEDAEEDPGRLFRPGYESRAGETAADLGEVETLNIGRRSSNVSWCLYRKTRQIVAAKDGDASTYASRWEAMGWDGEEEVSRVELRLCKRALVQQDETTGEVLNLRKPSALCELETLARVWASHTAKYRIIVDHGSVRRRRRATDPRWKTVQAVTSLSCTLKQDRSVQGATWKEATARSAKSALRALQRVAAMHGLSIVSPEGYGEVAAALALEAMRNDLPNADELLVEYGEAHIKARQEFLGPEMILRQPSERLPGTRRVKIEPPNLLPDEWLHAQ